MLVGANIAGVKYSLALGASIEARDPENNYTPLQWAVMALSYEAAVHHHDRTDLVEFLLKNGANVNDAHDQFPLRIACNYQDLKMVKLLLRYGADVDRYANDGFTKGHTRLYVAAQDGQSDIVISLLAYGAAIEDSILPQRLSPRFFGFGNYETLIKTIKALIYAGIDPQKKDKNGQISWKSINDKHALQILTNPLKIKDYCTKEEKKEFEEMMAHRR